MTDVNLDPDREFDIDSNGLAIDTMIEEAVSDSGATDLEINNDKARRLYHDLEPDHSSFRLIASSIILGARIIAAAIKEAKK
jgi:hypothetical protein